MKRRAFIGLVGGAAAWPLTARAQHPRMPIVGYLSNGSQESDAFRVAAIRKGLGEVGYVDGRNLEIDYRGAEGRADRLPELAKQLVQRPVDVIVLGSTATARVGKAATTTIPIVFVIAGDPVKLGLVESLNRPGGNLTGVSFLAKLLLQKRFEVLNETLPNAALIGFLVNPANPNADPDTRDIEAAAKGFGKQLTVVNAGNDDELETAFAALAKARADAVFVDDDPFFNGRQSQIVALAARYALPGSYSLREYATKGGLMAYGTSLSDSYRQSGVYAGRILKGEKPADLPVEQSTKVELVVNLRTAKTLGLTVPPSLLARADELIE
jgi:putative tryptophan/tyrosine transport system substrate-binding protein